MAEVYNAQGNINRLGVMCIDAYGVAVKNGFEGTIEEWLESLKGEKGEPGVDGNEVRLTLGEEPDGRNKVTIETVKHTENGDIVENTGTIVDGVDGKDGVDGLSVFYSHHTTGDSIGGTYSVKYDDVITNGRQIKVGDLICLANGYLYIITDLMPDFCYMDCLMKLVGDDGIDGRDGAAGRDGFSPIVSAIRLDGGVMISVTDAHGSTNAMVYDGAGSGGDGVSPVAKVEQTSSGAKITITDAYGTTTATVTNGKDGKDGVSPTVTAIRLDDGVMITARDTNGSTNEMVYDGAAGEPGVSPVARVEQTASGAKITIIDADGVTTATVTNGKDGVAGKDGAAGKDGFSPTVSASRVDDGAMITVTDVKGTKNVKVNDGKDGKDGVSPTVNFEQTSDGAKIFFTDSDGTHIVTLYNGEKGDKGDPGDPGEKGDRGDPGTLEMSGAKAGQIVAVSSVDRLGIPLTFEGVEQTHFTERVQILANTTIDGVLNYPNHLHLIEGQEYTVIWNGVEYVCTAVVFNGANMGLSEKAIGLGNLYAVDVPGVAQTNEPFTIGEFEGDPPVIIGAQDNSTTATISIYRHVIHKLDSKYLDLDWIPKKKGTVILPAQIARATNGITSVDPIDAKYRVEGTKIIVLIDGISHETEIHVDGNEVYANTEFGFNNRVIITFTASKTFMVGYGMEGRTVEICLPDSANSKIPVEYLPDGYNPSGSGGSSAPSDWNAKEGEPGHVLNRTHYKAVGEFFPEQTAVFDEEGLYVTEFDKELVAGNTYTVTWGGAKYECTAVSTDVGDGNFVNFIGNLSLLLGLGDTGEPFVFGTMGGIGQVSALDGSSSQTIKICEPVYHPLDRVYLPKMFHVVKLPTMENPPASGENGSVNITDPNGEIIKAVLDNIPIWLDLSEVRDGYYTKAQVIGASAVFDEATIRSYLQTGNANMVYLCLRAVEALNNCTWFVHVNAGD